MKNDICMCVKSNIKQQEMKHLVAAFYKLLGIRSTFKTSNGMSYFWKKKKQRGGAVEDILFQNPPGIFHFFTLPLEIPGKSKLHPWKLHKTLLHLTWKLQDSKYQDLWKLHIIFFLIPWKFHIIFDTTVLEIPYPQPPCLGFFWNNPI